MIAALCAGLYPNVCSIARSPKKYTQTIGGALEKELTLADLR